MNKKSLKLTCALVLSILATSFFSSCDKDTDSYVKVTTIDARTKKALSGTYVTLEQSGHIYAVAQTDGNGECTLSLYAPALMNIIAQYEFVMENNTSGKFYYYTGSNAVRFTDGETKEMTIEVDRDTDPLSQNTRPVVTQ